METISNLEALTTNNTTIFQPVDIWLIGKVLEKISTSNDVFVNPLTVLIHNLLQVDRSVLKQSQIDYNATDIILQSFDQLLSNAEVDYYQIFKGNVMSVVARLEKINITGVALYSTENSVNIEVINASMNMDDVLKNDNLVAAVIIPKKLLQDIVEIVGNNSKMIITVFLKDSLFNMQENLERAVISNIFGITFPGFKGSLSDPIKIIHRASKYSSKSCAYWKLSQTQNITSLNLRWIKDSDAETLENYTTYYVCECSHLTHFALLMFEDFYGLLEDDIIEILEYITTVNYILSLGGGVGIFLTCVFFKNWRKNKGNQMLMNFILAISLQVVMLYVSNFINASDDQCTLCTAVGALLHYSVLTEFCWMLVIALLQFKRYVRVLGGPPKYVIVKSCVFGWLAPLIPVAVLVSVSPDSYVKSLVGICYPSGNGLYLGVFLPIGVILAANVVIYILIVIDIFSINKEGVRKEMVFQVLLVVLLFFMLGLTWLFAFLTYILEWPVLICLFCFTSTLQGFVLFLFFIVFNKKTRNLYKKCFNKRCVKK